MRVRKWCYVSLQFFVFLLCCSVLPQSETSNKRRDDKTEDDPLLNNNPPVGDETESLPLKHQDIPAIVSVVMAATIPKAKVPSTIQPLRPS